MTDQFSCSLIISVYNQAPQLRQVLRSVAAQSVAGFEIIIADDGSSDDVVAVLAAFQQQHPEFPLTHLWHEDRGFYKTIILNRAVRAMRSDYLIVLDGDMLMHPRFIEYHLRYRAPERALCGYRGVKLQAGITGEILADETNFSTNWLVQSGWLLRAEMAQASRGLVIHSKLLRRRLAPPLGRLSGCNFSVDRGRILAINGWDETILEYGYEDLEMGHRLELAGLELVNVSRLCNTWHLFHASKKRQSIAAIRQRIREAQQRQCRFGIETLSSGSSVDDFRS